MKIILTNDDGFNEPGLVELHRRIASMGEVIVVAPKHPQSIVGHRVTLSGPIAVEQVSAYKYVVDGTPADCTRLAVKRFMRDADWVIAGINPGANLGSDTYQSGTVAAAREAAIIGIKAIAISQYIAPNAKIDWQVTGLHAARIMNTVMALPLKTGQFWNINLPHPITDSAPLSYVICERDRNAHIFDFRKEGTHYSFEGNFHKRPRTKGADVDVCLSGQIAVTRLDI